MCLYPTSGPPARGRAGWDGCAGKHACIQPQFLLQVTAARPALRKQPLHCPTVPPHGPHVTSRSMHGPRVYSATIYCSHCSPGAPYTAAPHAPHSPGAVNPPLATPPGITLLPLRNRLQLHGVPLASVVAASTAEVAPPPPLA